MSSALRALLDRARGPLGPLADPDFGMPGGPLAELGAILSETNGFFAFHGGIHVFRVGNEGIGYDLEQWNASDTWKDSYQGLMDGVFCFSQDLFGFQFGVVDGREVVVVDPETAEREVLGTSLEDWAGWLLADPNGNARAETALGWQDHFGPLETTDRLIHRQPLVLGGENELANIVARDAVYCMRARGPIAHAIKDLPDGAQIRFSIE